MTGRQPRIVEPRYGTGSITELLPSVLAALGVAGEVNALGLPAAPHYCVLLVDGLGWEQLVARPDAAPVLCDLAARPTAEALTAAVPSTTATSLASLGTGLPPGRHGVVGYTSRIPGTGSLLNALDWPKEISPLEWQPHATVYERAVSAGVSCRTIDRGEYRESGLTRAALRGSAYRSTKTLGQRLAHVASGSSAPSLTYLYEPDLDATGHRNGVASPAWGYQLALIDRFVEMLIEVLPRGTVLVITADHGMVDVGPEARVDAEADPRLMAGVSLIGGEARFRHVYVHDGAQADVAAVWREVLGPAAVVLTREEAVSRHWFGAVDGRVLDRIGDVVVACADGAVEVPSTFPFESRMRGFHGGMTSAEMRIPLLLAG